LFRTYKLKHIINRKNENEEIFAIINMHEQYIKHSRLKVVLKLFFIFTKYSRIEFLLMIV